MKSLSVLLFIFLTAFTKVEAQDIMSPIRDYASHVTIVRDAWGVPHIYGETDPDVAYGLAWANSEDDFETIQELILAARGLVGRVKGKDGAIIDFFKHAIGTDRIIKDKFSGFSGAYQNYLNAYAAGLNDFATTFPDVLFLKDILPITAMDVAKAYFVNLALTSGVHTKLKDIIDGTYDKPDFGEGSNAFAFSPAITKDDNTYLCINPHQPFDGPFSWYEAHLVSEEGMNVMGATFPGGASIYLGTNENLGWAHTSNGVNLVDVYKLEMHPKEKLKYEFDGEWYELEERKVKIKVKLKKWLPKIGVRKTTYWSLHGPTFKSKKGNFYAVRYPANEEIRAVEQWYWMNKANNLEEFNKALELSYLPKYNVIYADKEGNIFYLNNGLIPVRDTSCSWEGVLPGNTSKTLWKQCHSVSSLPRVANPECGYVFNMNNTPYDATCNDNDIQPAHPGNMGFYMSNTNRSMRFRELMENYALVDFEDMKDIKFDDQFPDSSLFISSLENLFQLDEDQYPAIADMIRIIKSWDRKTTAQSPPASVLLLTLDYILKKMNVGDIVFRNGVNVSDEIYVEALTHAKKHLLQHFGSVNVPLNKLQRHRKGGKDYPLPGYPDVLAANYSKMDKDGRYVGFIGDSYTMFVAYDKNGVVRLESLHPYGASDDPESIHYTDQMEIFTQQQTKTITLDKKTIFENAAKIYQPKDTKYAAKDQ